VTGAGPARSSSGADSIRPSSGRRSMTSVVACRPTCVPIIRPPGPVPPERPGQGTSDLNGPATSRLPDPRARAAFSVPTITALVVVQTGRDFRHARCSSSACDCSSGAAGCVTDFRIRWKRHGRSRVPLIVLCETERLHFRIAPRLRQRGAAPPLTARTGVSPSPRPGQSTFVRSSDVGGADGSARVHGEGAV
jgi:hypothetical protein